MRAVVARGYGGPEAIEIREVPVPEAGPGQVRVLVEAATVNPVDLVTRAGLLVDAGLMAPREVTGLGWDVAGVVDAVGAGVTGFSPGDRVIGTRDLLDVSLGAYAELVVLDASAVAHAPAGLSPVEAATLPLNGLTALQSLALLDLPPGETLLITGAAGAVGGFAVELAALPAPLARDRRPGVGGLRVVALAGAADEEAVRKLGAEWFVARDAKDLPAAVRALAPGGVAGALDAALLGVPALASVRTRGAFVTVAGGAPAALRGIRVSTQWIAADGENLAWLAALADRGLLTPRVADTLPLTAAAAAHERVARGGLRGRLVLTPRGRRWPPGGGGALSRPAPSRGRSPR